MTTPAILDRSPAAFLVRPAPRREPLFDDELGQDQRTLAGPLDRPLPFDGLDIQPQPSMRLTMVSDAFPSRAIRRPDLPELSSFARRLIIAIVETATGRRPAAHLSQHTSPAVQSGIARDAGRITRLGTAQRPATLHSLHCYEPADGVAEIAAIVRVGDRFRAIAFRLEGLEGRWRCVRLQIG